MSDDITESELIFKIFRVKNEEGVWSPALGDVKSHDITALWTASLAYLILDRYLSCIDESKQNEFQEEVLYWLNLMVKDNKGSEFTEKIKYPDIIE